MTSASVKKIENMLPANDSRCGTPAALSASEASAPTVAAVSSSRL